MSGESFLPFLFFVAVLVFSLIVSRGKKTSQASPIQTAPIKKTPVAPIKQPAAKQLAIKPPMKKLPAAKHAVKIEKTISSYEVEKKKEISFLKKKWQDKDALKQAFILSEILKKVDERNLF